MNRHFASAEFCNRDLSLLLWEKLDFNLGQFRHERLESLFWPQPVESDCFHENLRPTSALFIFDPVTYFATTPLGRIWSVEVNIPCDVDVQYRYFISSIDPSNQSSVHVRKWETHLKTRVIPQSSEPQAFSDVETFGIINGVQKVDKGWLTNETIIQFKFFNNPFNLKERIKNRLLYVKVNLLRVPTPVRFATRENSF